MKSISQIAIACFALCLVTATALAAGQKSSADRTLDRFLGNEPQFFKLLPFNIPVIRDGRVVTQVSLIVSVETFGLPDKEKVMAARHKLQNAFLQDLYGVVGIHHGDGRPFVAESVKIRLTRLARRIVGANVVKDVLIESSFNMRPRK